MTCSSAIAAMARSRSPDSRGWYDSAASSEAASTSGLLDVQNACTPGVERANLTPRSIPSAVRNGSYQLAVSTGLSPHGRHATALMAMTPTSRSAHSTSRASASARYTGSAQTPG